MNDDHPERERDGTSDDPPTDATPPADAAPPPDDPDDADDVDARDDATARAVERDAENSPGTDPDDGRPDAPDDAARASGADGTTGASGADAGAGPGGDEPGDDDTSDRYADEAFGSAEFDADDPLLDDLGLDDHDIEHIQRDLDDLADFESAFRPEGYRGVAVWCQDCAEEHFYPWDMLRENLQVLLETGETPVHEPAFAPEPERYVPWDYARGYVDALRDAGVDQRLDVDACPRCRLPLGGEAAQANYCPRCAAPLLAPRLLAALTAQGLDPAHIDAILREAGLPR